MPDRTPSSPPSPDRPRCPIALDVPMKGSYNERVGRTDNQLTNMSQKNLLQDYSPSKQVELEKMFFTLAEQWRNETGMQSSPTKKLKHPAYQQIINMGEPVLPLILRELERNKDHWFLALIAIAGENPVSPEDDFSQAVAAWLRWGREKGLI